MHELSGRKAMATKKCCCCPDPRVVKEDGHIETPEGRKLCFDKNGKGSVETWKDPHWGSALLGEILHCCHMTFSCTLHLHILLAELRPFSGYPLPGTMYAYIRAYIPAYIRAYIHACIHAYTHTPTHTHIHTNTYIHTYIYIYVRDMYIYIYIV